MSPSGKVLKKLLGCAFSGAGLVSSGRAEYLAEKIDETAPLSEVLHGLYRRFDVPSKDSPP